MARIEAVEGKLANSAAEMLVCPVDCQGAAARAPSWDAARSMRRSFAAVFATYAVECRRGVVSVGWVRGYQLPERERARMRKGTGLATRVIVLVALKEQARDRAQMDAVDRVLPRLREIVEGERISSVAMAALGYEPDGASWDDTWPGLKSRFVGVFGDLPGGRGNRGACAVCASGLAGGLSERGPVAGGPGAVRVGRARAGGVVGVESDIGLPYRESGK